MYHMGNLLQKRGEVKDAAKMYRSAVNLDPTHKASHYNLGACLVGRDVVWDGVVGMDAEVSEVIWAIAPT